jgi:large subunit ribosomal protein L4
LTTLGADSSALVVTAEPENNLIKSARNLKGIKTMPANLLNILDILSHKMLIMTVAAVRKAEQLWEEQTSQEVKNAPL